MAASLSMLDPMTGARPGEYFLDSKPVDTFETRNTIRAAEAEFELATTQNPQAEVDMSQEGNPSIVYNSMTQSWLNASRHYFHDTSALPNSQNLPVTEHGFRYERAQGFSGEELNSGIVVDIASRHEYQQSASDSLLGNNQQRVLLTFPEGEADAVPITERDMKGLQPTEYLGNNIVDFYIKYLERGLPSKDRERFYFFNSFFFTKLLRNNSASKDIDQCKVDYEQVRKWSGEVNLFEKDYIFIPVLRSSHWSLIIICHLSSLWSSPDERKGSPCILHLDAVEGKHENFKSQVRSYISRAWMEKYQASNDKDQLLDLCQMKYVQAQVPQQHNSYDCGLYLLHYVEVFLLQSTSLNLNFSPRKGVPLFTRPRFAEEVAVKRMFIESLILGLSRISQEQGAKSMDSGLISQELPTCLDGKDVQSNGVSMFDTQGDESKHVVHAPSGVIAVDNNHEQCPTGTEHTDHQANWCTIGAHQECQSRGEVTMDRKQQSKDLPCAALLKPSKVTNKRKWNEDETSILLNCKIEGGRFCKENQTATRWDIISQEIKNRLGTVPSADQCRLRYDTLLKAYKTIKNYCMKNGTTFSKITAAERLELKLATALSEGWYKAIDEICRRFPHKSQSRKRVKLSPSDSIGLLSLSPSNPVPLRPPVPVPDPAPAPVPTPISAPAPIPAGSCNRENSPPRQVAIPGFSTLNEDLRSTLLNLIQVKDWRTTISELELICQKLAIVQDRQPSDIRIFVFQLWELKLVNIEFVSKPGVISDVIPFLKLSDVQMYKKFSKKVLRKNPDFNIYLRISDNYASRSFPKAPLSLSLQRIRVLDLYKCQELEHVDLSYFPELRALAIKKCHNLKEVRGWEVGKELGWLEIRGCRSLIYFPCVQCLPSLREFRFNFNGSLALQMSPMPDFSQCVRLRRLEIWSIDSSALNSMDLRTLRFLEVLTIWDFPALTTIQGLSGLHSLTRLNLQDCRALRRVAELGCLKGLTRLDVSGSGVEEISGVQELHLLTFLDLHWCSSLKMLPCVGHLKALAYLGMSFSGVEEIPGVEGLVNLETLDCSGSRVKWLPDPHHFPRLQWVGVHGTPLSRTDPSSCYYGKGVLRFNSKEEKMGFVDVISDVSDTKYSHSDDDSY